jgi:hypothetical protein
MVMFTPEQIQKRTIAIEAFVHRLASEARHTIPNAANMCSIFAAVLDEEATNVALADATARAAAVDNEIMTLLEQRGHITRGGRA